MIKLKDILRESKASGMLAEAFRSSILRKMVNNFQGLDRDFFTYGAKLGVQWDKVRDSQIEKNAKPKKKGIEFAVATKKIDLPSKKRYGDYNSINQVEKGTALIVLKDGKPLWYTKSWRNVDQKRKGATGKGMGMRAGIRSSLYGDDKMSFGIDKFGYQSLAAVQSLPARAGFSGGAVVAAAPTLTPATSSALVAKVQPATQVQAPGSVLPESRLAPSRLAGPRPLETIKREPSTEAGSGRPPSPATAAKSVASGFRPIAFEMVVPHARLLC